MLKAPEDNMRKPPSGVPDAGLVSNPLDFNPPPMVKSVRDLARYNRLLEARAEGQDVPDAELEAHRIAAYGRV
jgi:hypothetical protein